MSIDFIDQKLYRYGWIWRLGRGWPSNEKTLILNRKEMKTIQEKILREIPILSAMQMCIVELKEFQSILSFPLEPNHNHKGTAFGGSLYSASTAACYALLYGLQQKAKSLNRDLVIVKGEMKYMKPTSGNFFAIAEIQEQDFDTLLNSFSIDKPHRIKVNSYIRTSIAGQNLCEFIGEFAFIQSAKNSL